MRLVAPIGPKTRRHESRTKNQLGTIRPIEVVSLTVLFAILGFVNPPKLVKQFELKDHFAYEVVIDLKTKNVAWQEPGEKRGVYLYLTHSKKVVKLAVGQLGTTQVDCDTGLVSVHVGSSRTNDMQTKTFQMSTGATVGNVKGHLRRIGKLFQEKGAIVDLNGKVVHPIPAGRGQHPDYIANLIWDGPRRLAIVGQGDRYNDTKDVVALDKDWKKGKRVKLSDFAMDFTKIVGNPDRGVFAVFENSNQSILTTGIFNKDLSPVPFTGRIQVTDIGSRGVLAVRLTRSDRYNIDNPDGGICLDHKTGQVLWQGPSAGKWYGGNVFTGNQILDGQTGKVLHSLQLPKSAGDIREFSSDLVVASSQHPKKIVAYRIQ